MTIPQALIQSFRSRVRIPDDPSKCWRWMAGVSGGYGMFWTGKKNEVTHRIMYELLHGEIRKIRTLDHLCRNRICCNPSHLEVVTIGENVLRGEGPTAVNARRTECKSGHSFNKENTYYRKSGGRACRVCVKLASKAWRKSKKYA